MKFLVAALISLAADLVLALFFMILWNMSMSEMFKPIGYWQSFSVFVLASFIYVSLKVSDKLSED